MKCIMVKNMRDTLLETLLSFQKRFKLKNKPIIVADRGMLNDANIAFLENNGYKYILGAKIKMLPSNIKEKIVNLTFIDDSVTQEIDIHKTIKYKKDKQTHSLNISQRLILSYSSKRAKKDRHLREKALDKLKAKIEPKPKPRPKPKPKKIKKAEKLTKKPKKIEQIAPKLIPTPLMSTQKVVKKVKKETATIQNNIVFYKVVFLMNNYNIYGVTKGFLKI